MNNIKTTILNNIALPSLAVELQNEIESYPTPNTYAMAESMKKASTVVETIRKLIAQFPDRSIERIEAEVCLYAGFSVEEYRSLRIVMEFAVEFSNQIQTVYINELADRGFFK
jgi:hypothetical protein